MQSAIGKESNKFLFMVHLSYRKQLIKLPLRSKLQSWTAK